jgi:hypothetical protein
MRKLLVMVALLIAVPGVAAAGGGGGVLSQCAGFAAGSELSMYDSCFSGVAHFAPTGTVTISNSGALTHTFTAVDGLFDSGQMDAGETFELVLDEPGIYQVFCSLHGTADGSGMAGVLVVGDAEPSPVAASFDVSSIRQTVAEENQALVEAVERQTVALGNLSAAQATLRKGLEVDAEASGREVASSPTILTLPAESTDQPWVPLTTGVAAGLAFAALFVAHRPQQRESESEMSNRTTGMVVPIEES